MVWSNSNRYATPATTVSLQTLARYGESLYETVATIELTLILCGAALQPRLVRIVSQGQGYSRISMLDTNLSNTEIVLGKLGVRLVPVLGLIACVLPLTAITSLLGGIDPLTLFGSFLTAIACATLACSLGLTLSVWGRKTHEVLMSTYLILVLWLISPVLVLFVADSFGLSSPSFSMPSIWAWIECSTPYYLAFALIPIQVRLISRAIWGS